jgi:(p)ppGpp synthase/HD superfamily hydrolase
MLYYISKCCSPVPGEPIVGVVTRSRGVSVHREECKSLNKVEPERIMEINWANTDSKKMYVTKIIVEVLDRLGVSRDVLGKISDNRANITRANIKTKSKTFALIEVEFEISDLDHLNRIISSITSVSDVISVKRQQSGVTKSK